MYCALLVFCTVRSLSKIEFHALLFGKRVQRYGLFPNWQNLSATFFQEFAKKEDLGQNNRTNWGKWDNKRADFTPKSTLFHFTFHILHFTACIACNSWFPRQSVLPSG